MSNAELVEKPMAESLMTQPIYETVDAQRLALLQATVAKDAQPQEIAMFLELAQRYNLDPFAKEIWCAVSTGQRRQVLIMVARDGLRKIAQRNGLRIDGDVVRENDEFKVTRTREGRHIEHSYAGGTEKRGKIVGAWAQVWTGGAGEERGYFFAPIEEYMPTSEGKLKYSPWGSQKGVMILSGAERQALRQATPLSGLLVEGEMDLNEERALSPVDERKMLREFVASLDTTEEIKNHLGAAIAAANEVATGSFSLGKAQMTLLGRDDEGLMEQARAIIKQTEEIVKRAPDLPASDRDDPEADISDAEVVEEPPTPEPVAQDKETLEARLSTLHDQRAAADAPDSELDKKIDEVEAQLVAIAQKEGDPS